ncbi:MULTISPECIES: SAM-dependent methyltransferase [unclassified Pseudoxanthomonas]|uniref:SAM-dependent methyltransferase n=1 Tax=unclassified Pseudoxanthomonas TaxID=2645906 RepID=UPI00307F7755
MKSGSLACVGLGMTMGAHLAPRARSFIEEADTVFVAASDPLVELWVQQMHDDVRSLQPYYAEGKSRNESYEQMVDAMLELVRAGRRVCGAFYGHPGVFACVPHRAIDRARSEGFDAVMEAAVSAEDCLYADLGIDPGTYGCQHYEASQFMMYRRKIDPTAFLVLWQVGVAGDSTLSRLGTGAAHRKILLEILSSDYPSDHLVTMYEAATLPLAPPRIESIPLNELVDADLGGQTTLVVPPSRPMELNPEVASRLKELEA